MIIFKIFDHIYARIIIPVVDNNIWRLKENGHNIIAVKFETHRKKIKEYYPEIDTVQLLEKNPSHYEFLLHNFTSYIFEIKNVFLEPEYGWVILKPFKIFKFSFPLVNDPWDIKKTRPSTIRFLSPFRKTVFLKEAISIRYAWQNFYHFFIDTLSQLFLLEENNVPRHIPVIVSYEFPEIKYVQEFLDISSFISRKIIVQTTSEYFHVEKLIICKDTFYSESIFEVVRSIDHIRECSNNEKIFIFRPLDHGRAILNFNEIKELMIKFGYKLVDSSKLTLREQISLFSGASEVVGIHGAGLTNIIFRTGYPLKLLEIFPGKELTPQHYKNLSSKLGFEYSNLVGEMNTTDTYKNFNLSATLLEEKMLSFFGYKDQFDQ